MKLLEISEAVETTLKLSRSGIRPRKDADTQLKQAFKGLPGWVVKVAKNKWYTIAFWVLVTVSIALMYIN